ncbi:MAG TPA: ribonuclease III [Phycisphaerae bacterium]|nr:ribonuclease III [Phycisphaerae bacterium]HNU43915.1 ribonuclease III [Phycisphaerae bacterium]
MSEAELIPRAEAALGYKFRNPELLVIALTHASLADNRLVSNERMEFLGDAVLGLVVCTELYRRYQDRHEGDLTKVKSVVVSRRVCAAMAEHVGLTELLRLGKGIGDRNGLPVSVQAAVLEAVIGAIYLDGGLEPAEKFVRMLTLPHIERASRFDDQQNHKSLLQQYVQRALATTPQYEWLDEQGPDHSKCFEVCVVVDGRRFPSAWGTSKKEAEQEAARRALQVLRAAEAEPQVHHESEA